MLSISSDTQLRAYAAIRTLEARAQAFETMVGGLKRLCVHGGSGTGTDLIGATADLRWQLRQLSEHARELEQAVGFGANKPAPARDGARESAPRDLTEPPGLRGTTDSLGVAELVGMLSSGRKTGTLTLQAGDTMYVFEFQGGAIVHAVTNQQDPEFRLGTILVAQSKLTEEQLQTSLENCSAAQEMLGEHLVRSQTVSAPDLRAALEVQVQRIFEAVFDLRGAKFSFLDGTLSQIAQRASLNTTHLLLEAARQGDERRRGVSTGAVTKSALDSILRG
jgi:hypothetical protein